MNEPFLFLPKKLPDTALDCLKNLARQHVLQHHTPFASTPFELINKTLLLELLDTHRMELVAYPILKKNLPQAHEFLQNLQHRCQTYTLKHLQQLKILKKLAIFFQQHDLPYVFYKGQVLNQILYDQQCIRRSKDIDILIQPSDLLRIHDYFISIGFRLLPPVTPYLLTIPKNTLLKLLRNLCYINDENIIIELHWQLTYMGNLNLDCWQEKHQTSVVLANLTIPIFNPEDNFFYLCQHAAFHHWNRLQWLIDIAIFQKKIPLDWEKIYYLAKINHCVRALMDAKILLKEWFDYNLNDMKTSSIDKLAQSLHLRYVKKKWKTQHNPSIFDTCIKIFYRNFLLPGFWLKYHRMMAAVSELGVYQLQNNPNRSASLILAIAFVKKLFQFLLKLGTFHNMPRLKCRVGKAKRAHR